MTAPVSVAALARSAWQDFGRVWRALLSFQVAFKLLDVWLLTPIVAGLLAGVMSQSGHVAVSNHDLVTFLLSPLGALYATLLGLAVLALFLLELAGTVLIVARCDPAAPRHTAWTPRQVLATATGVVRLGLVKLVWLALILAPFAVAAAVICGTLLSQFDIYFYWKERPREFWMAVALGLPLLLAATAALAWFSIRWALALPIMLLEGTDARTALRASRDRARGVEWQLGGTLAGWLLASLGAGTVAISGYRMLATALLDRAGDFPLVPILALLALQDVVLAVWSSITILGFALLIWRFYVLRSPASVPAPASPHTVQSSGEPPVSNWNSRITSPLIAAVLFGPVIQWGSLLATPRELTPVSVTAHRGHAQKAPENTLSAIEQAIVSRADFVEVDVHQTADGVVVLLHDRDLMRVARDPRRLDQVNSAELKNIDVGSWFDARFAGERTPTLVEAIALCRGKIRMNIELKLFSSDLQLAGAVAELVRDQGFESECIVTSLSYEACRECKRRNPRLTTGLIVGQALGDVNRLETDLFSVRADLVSAGLIREAHRQGREVHVWSLTSERRMSQFIERGVDNLIVSDPDAAIRVRDEWAALSGGERLILSGRLWLEP